MFNSFSRKDALRRHWMVRGCRGEEGATAPITPTYPLNGNPPPALSPNTPPTNANSNENSNGSNGNSGNGNGNNSNNGNNYGSSNMSFSHPSAPPPLTTLPPRQSSDQPSQIILTPSEGATGQRGSAADSEIDSGITIDPALSGLDSSRNSNATENTESSYFDVMRKEGNGVSESATSSNFSRYATSPKDDMRHHPYRRSPLPSPSTHNGHPMGPGPDGKGMFAMPFSGHGNGMLAPIDSEDMSKEASTDSVDPASSWNRW